jgi:tetratricopeptide (TPR) repeat protein
MALAYFGEDIDAMIALVDRAVSLNPSFARGWYISGILRGWKGQPEVAIEHLETALRLAPRGRFGIARHNLGMAYFLYAALRGRRIECAACHSGRT